MTETSNLTNVRQRPIATLGWAAFLAVSWTWCIGMFLPALLLRDHGTWAWVVFAVPNVIGAAAMGWVLQRPGASERLVARHSAAMTAFSVVTILFHVLFVGWVVRWLSEYALGNWAFVAAAAGVAIVCLPLLTSPKVALPLSGLVWAGSVTAFVVAVVNTDRLVVPAGEASIDLLYLAPVCLVGFVLCPYLDLTFHRARQALGTYGAVAAFTLGFGALFLAMIVFTLWYGPMLLPPDALRGTLRSNPIPHMVALAVVAHMAGQSGFTVAAHTLEVARRLRKGAPRGGRSGLIAGTAFGVAVLAAAAVVQYRFGTYQWLGAKELSGHEMGYRLFMAFYGLIAPAYVWLFLYPWPNARSTDRQRWTALVVVLLLGGAAYWVGFVEERMVWLLAGVGVVLLSRPVLEWTAKGRTGDK